MEKEALNKLKESFFSVLPITVIVLIMCLLTGIPKINILTFFISAILLVLGMFLFNMGANMSLMTVGEKLGKSLAKSNKLWLIMIIVFIIGIIITIAEPDLRVLATQITSIENWILILSVSVGVGLFLVISIIRTIFRFNLSILLVILYLIAFILCIFIPPEFIGIAFDAGGVTTGPISVPFIVAIGLGFSLLRSDAKKKEDSFGTVALCSIGPIITVLILGLFCNLTSAYPTYEVSNLIGLEDILTSFNDNAFYFFKDILLALLPITILIIIYQLFNKALTKKEIKKTIYGILFVYLGLTIFLTGINMGFMPIGYLIGTKLALASYKIIILPLGFIMGYFMVYSEPAVHILNSEVEYATEGLITSKMMLKSLSIGVGAAVLLSLARTYFDFSILYLLIPGYAIALGLTFFCPRLFTNIAFDSGGVASGTMTVSFMLPLAIGVSTILSDNILTDAFGLIAMVALTPLIAIQIMGIVYKIKLEVKTKKSIVLNETFIEYDCEVY